MNNNHSTTVRRGDEATTKPSSPLKSRRSMQTAKHFPRHFVQHDYKDHADEVDTTGGMIPVKRKRGGVLVPFPIKLYDALERIEEEGNAHVIGWQPHGRCFIIRDPKVFVNELMPRYVPEYSFDNDTSSPSLAHTNYPPYFFVFHRNDTHQILYADKADLFSETVESLWLCPPHARPGCQLLLPRVVPERETISYPPNDSDPNQGYHG